MTDKIKFTVPGKPEYLTLVRLSVGSVADLAGFNYEEIEDIKTAVSEACRTVSCHGFEGFAEEYTISCEIEEGKIELLIADTGKKHDVEKKGKPCFDCPNEGNLAIFVAKSLMDSVEVVENEYGAKYVKMVKSK